MKVKSLFIASLIVFSTLNATSLIEEAKNSGLVPLPKDQKGVDEILKQNGVEASEFTLEKAELGKNFILSHVFQKVVLFHVILVII